MNNVDGVNVRCLVASVCCSVMFFSTSVMTFNLLRSILTCLQGMVRQASMSKRYGMKTGITGNNNRNKSKTTILNHITTLNVDLNNTKKTGCNKTIILNSAGHILGLATLIFQPPYHSCHSTSLPHLAEAW